MKDLFSHSVARRTVMKGILQASVIASAGRTAWAASGSQNVAAQSNEHDLTLDARDFGATGDGKTLDTAAVQAALDRCSVLGGGTVVVRAGRYLIGSIFLRSGVTLELSKGATLAGSPDLSHYRVAQVRWEGKWIPGYTALIHAWDAEHIAVRGEGAIEGNVAVSGRPGNGNPLRRPPLIEFIGCRGVRLEGFSTSYAHMWSIHPTYCDDVVIRGLTIRSTETNGDGIDLDSCRNVVIDSCDIASGDDCISLKSGRGLEAHLINRPTENVRIANCVFEGRGFSCIGIGTEASGGIRNVLIERCRITGVNKHAIYIKSRVGRGATIEKITLREIDAENMRFGFLRINQVSAGVQDQNPVPGIDGVPLFRDFTFENIRVHNAPVLVQATETFSGKVLDGLTLRNISGTARKGISIANARRVDIKGISITGCEDALLKVVNVTGRGLDAAGKLDAPADPELVAASSATYRLG